MVGKVEQEGIGRSNLRAAGACASRSREAAAGPAASWRRPGARRHWERDHGVGATHAAPRQRPRWCSGSEAEGCGVV